MPDCQNCGAFVTEQYVRVFAPNGLSQPRVCPYCPDKIRDGAEVRAARSSRSNSEGESGEYSPPAKNDVNE